MDPVEQINREVQGKVNGLGTEIIRFGEEKKRILARTDLPDDAKTGMIEPSREALVGHMETIFGEADGSINQDIDGIVEACSGQAVRQIDRVRKAAGVWRRELPDLRRFLEYCAEMIEEHPGELSPEIQKSQKCVTEATVVLERITSRVELEVKT